MDKSKTYLTAGKIARLYNISKQTIIFYEKSGLLMPACIGDNGYRYYTESQLHTLETILFLREINTPIAIIKQYLYHQSADGILAMIEKKKEDCLQQIIRDKELLHALHHCEKLISSLPQMPLDRVLLQEMPECSMFATSFENMENKKIPFTKARSIHMEKVYSLCSYKDQLTGYTISSNDFLGHQFSKIKRFITKADTPHSGGLPGNFTRPAGLYTFIYTKGSCIEQSIHALEGFRRFWENNQLVPQGDIYCFPVSKHWTAKSQKEYIRSFAIRVITPE